VVVTSHSPDLLNDERVEIRGCKKALETRVLVPGAIYSPTVDQERFTARMDLAAARRASSFDKLCREVETLVASG